MTASVAGWAARLLAGMGLLALCLYALATFGAGAADRYTDEDFQRIEKIDAHVHLHGGLPAFIARAQADNFRLLTINVNYADFPPLPEQMRQAVTLHQAHPVTVAFAASFDASGSESPGWVVPTQRQLDEAIARGAVAIKVWKDIGMQLRDRDGRPVMVDDARFTPIFRALTDRHVVVLGHQGEPRNAWLPLEQMTIKGDREYFAEHPQYHMFSHPEWPSYEEQLAARDRLLAHHPQLQFVGVHLASLEWDVDRVSAFLSRYPNASVDLAARLVHLQRQAVTSPDKVRAFFIANQDRILYGTDLTGGAADGDVAMAEEAHEAWFADWRFLAGDTVMASDQFDGSFQGLALPRSVIDKIYSGNARRLFPTAWGGAARAP